MANNAVVDFSDVGFLGFDVFGTVVDWRNGIAREAAPFLARHGVKADPFAFADAWRARYQPAMEAVRSGARPWVKLDVLNRENLDIVLDGFGAELDALNGAWSRLDAWPDAIEGLSRLKRRFPIGPVSNGHIAGMLNLARFAGLPWDVILGAEIGRNYKPRPEVYLASAAAAGLPPERVAMVAAHNDDLAAARALGLRTVFVRRPLEHGPHQDTDLQPAQDWDVVADSLIDVADLLQAGRAA